MCQGKSYWSRPWEQLSGIFVWNDLSDVEPFIIWNPCFKSLHSNSYAPFKIILTPALERNTGFLCFCIKYYLQKKTLISYSWCNVYQRPVCSGEWTRPSHKEENSYGLSLPGMWYLTWPHHLTSDCFLWRFFVLGLIAGENVQPCFIPSSKSLEILFIRLTWNLLIRVEGKLHGAM